MSAPTGYEVRILLFILLVLLSPLTLGCFTVEISFASLLLFKSVGQGVLVCIIDGCQKGLLADFGVNKQTACLFLKANDDFLQWHFVLHSLLPDHSKASGWLKRVLTLVLRHIAPLWRSITTTVFVRSEV